MNKGELSFAVEKEISKPIKAVTFGHNTQESHHMATSQFDGEVCLWDLNKFDVPVAKIAAHEGMINAMDGALHSGSPEIVTGGRDGKVRIFDTRQTKKAVCDMKPSRDSTIECWCVAFGNSFSVQDRVVAAGYDNADIKLFDLRMMSMVHEFRVGNGVCHLEFDRPDIAMNKLYVSTLEGRVRVYDLRTLHPVLGFAYVEERIGMGTVWTTKCLPQNRDVFMSGGGGTLVLNKYCYPPQRSVKDEQGVEKGVAGSVTLLNEAKLGDQPIHALDFHPLKEGLGVVASFDQSVKVVMVTKLNLIS
jgi:hypothetical protein